MQEGCSFEADNYKISQWIMLQNPPPFVPKHIQWNTIPLMNKAGYGAWIICYILESVWMPLHSERRGWIATAPPLRRS